MTTVARTQSDIHVSVIIPFYKEIELIRDAVHSVIMQNNSENCTIEIIIGNDGLYTAGQILDALPQEARDKTIVVKNELDRGAGNARNCAINAATGNYFAFLDADDIWHEFKIAAQLKLMNSSGANFTATAYKFIDSENIISPPKILGSTVDFLKNSSIGTSTVLITRDLLGNDRFLNLRSSQDTELWARLAGKAQFRYASTDNVFTTYRPSSRTSNKAREFLRFRDVVCLFEIPIGDRLVIYIRYITRGIINHMIKKVFRRLFPQVSF